MEVSLIWCFSSEWIQWSSLRLSARSKGWMVDKPTFQGPFLSSSSGFWHAWGSSLLYIYLSELCVRYCLLANGDCWGGL